MIACTTCLVVDKDDLSQWQLATTSWVRGLPVTHLVPLVGSLTDSPKPKLAFRRLSMDYEVVLYRRELPVSYLV